MIRFLLVRDDIYHQRGYWVLARALRDENFEVILGGVQTAAGIVRTAIQEDADMIGYRIMNASPQILIERLFNEMSKSDIADIPVVVGGIIPKKDEIFIRKKGVKQVFHPYTPLDALVREVRQIAISSQGKKDL